LDQKQISHRYSSCCCCCSCWGRRSSKSQAPSFQTGTEWNLARLFFK